VKTYLVPKFLIGRDSERCIQCQVRVNQCTFDTHYYDAEDDEVRSQEENCVSCHRCVLFCPARALAISRNPVDYQTLQEFVGEFASHFGYDAKEILEHRFIRLFPVGFDPTAGFMPINGEVGFVWCICKGRR
jgi:Fe-S-cluster-containing hydrogenase component 2